MLSEQQIERYSRQIILPQFGGRGQEALLSSALSIVGDGDVAATAAVYLAAAGLGRLTVSTPALMHHLDGLNPDCRVRALPTPVTLAGAQELARGSRIVLASGTPRDVCNRLYAACISTGTPLIYGSASGSRGLVSLHTAADPCPACVCTEAARRVSDDAEADVLGGATAAFIGTLQATEAIKYLVGIGHLHAGHAWLYDALVGRVDAVTARRDPHCLTCLEAGA